MDDSTLQPRQEITENGVFDDLRSLCASLDKIRDPRKARSTRAPLTTWLVIIFVAKLWARDTGRDERLGEAPR